MSHLVSTAAAALRFEGKGNAMKIGLGTLMLLALVAEESAEPIRVVVALPPGNTGPLAQQVRSIENALRESRESVALASSLADADAVVQFTGYSRIMRDGKSQDRYRGHYVLLQQGGTPQRFGMVAFETEDWQVEPVLEMLGRTLGRALGLAPATQRKPPAARQSDGI
jgi:hypothetical protein